MAMMIIMFLMILNLYADLSLIKDCDYEVDSDNDKDTHDMRTLLGSVHELTYKLIQNGDMII